MSDTDPASITRNTLFNVAGALVPIGVALVTIPLYLDVIGEARYGVLALAWLALGYFAVFDLGTGRALAHRIARMRASTPTERGTVFWTAAGVNAGLGLVGCVVVLPVVYVLLGGIVSMPEALEEEALRAVPFLAVATPFVMLLSVCTGALEGLQRFLAVNVLGVSTIAVYQIAPLIVAYLAGPNLTWLLGAAAAAPVFGAMVGFILCLPLVRAGGWPHMDRASASSLLRYGGWVTVTGLIGPLLTFMDRLAIAAVIGARAVAQYTVPFSVVGRLSVLPASLARTLFPRFSSLSADDARAVAARALVELAALTTPVAILLLVLLEPFLELWVGESLAEVASPVGAILIVGVWINGLASIPFTLLQGQGRPDLPAKFHVLELAPYAVALWVGLRWGGLEGAAVAWTARVTLDAGLLFGAARVSVRPRTLAIYTALVSGTCIAALTAFANPLWRVVLGGSLTISTLWWAWAAVPGLRQSASRAIVGLRASQQRS